MKYKSIYSLSLLLIYLNVDAYETTTYEEFAHKAYEQSVLSSEIDIWENLGIEQNENILALRTTPFTKKRLGQTKAGETNRSPLAIVRSGAHFEDNFPKFLNHFFDPYNNEPLTVLGVGIGEKSVDWILEDLQEFSSQEYSYKDARSYFYAALTSTDMFGQEIQYGKVFRSLGHILHHIGDMTQPQHVRNDLHPPGGDPSYYEMYTGNVTKGVSEEGFDGHLQSQLFAQMGSYAPVIFTKARDYWHTDLGGYGGMGLAEFTNREFVSKDTNFGMPDAKAYDLPNKDDEEKVKAFIIDDAMLSVYGGSV